MRTVPRSSHSFLHAHVCVPVCLMHVSQICCTGVTSLFTIVHLHMGTQHLYLLSWAASGPVKDLLVDGVNCGIADVILLFSGDGKAPPEPSQPAHPAKAARIEIPQPVRPKTNHVPSRYDCRLHMHSVAWECISPICACIVAVLSHSLTRVRLDDVATQASGVPAGRPQAVKQRPQRSCK